MNQLTMKRHLVMLYLLMGSIIFKPWEKSSRARVDLWRRGSRKCQHMENQSRLGWAGSDPEIPAWDESDGIPALCSVAPWKSSSFTE